MGYTDLSSTADNFSLAERIRAGDAKGISTFRELHVRQMKSYCEVACSPELVDEAIGAAFVDFLGRVTEGAQSDEELEGTLFQATRAAVAARIVVEATQAECLAVPELLAAQANDELPGDDRVLRDHLLDCPVCQATRARMEQAKRAFWPEPEPVAEPELVAEPEPERAAEPEPEPEPVVEVPPEPPLPEPEPEPEPEPGPPEEPLPEPEPVAAPPPPPPPPQPEPAPEPTPPPAPAPPQPIVVRRRSGGVVGAIRKRVRPPLS